LKRANKVISHITLFDNHSFSRRRFQAMKRYLLYLFAVLALLGGILLAPRIIAHAAASSCVTPNATNTLHGAIGGANYTIAVPSNWNGTLVLYSHGYIFSNQPLANPAPAVGDAATGAVPFQQGVALAGASYCENAW